MSKQSSVVSELVQEFVANIKSAARAELLAELGAAVSGKPGTSKAPKLAGVRAKGAKREPDEIVSLTEKLRQYVQRNPGQRIEQIASGLNLTTRELNLPAKKLIADKRVTTKGQKRATTYFARAQH